MKTIFTAIFLALFSVLAIAQTRFEKAKKTASEQNELILLNFSGSDWCIPCIKLHKNIIETETFKQLTTDHILEYVNADFPRSKKNQPSAEIKKENASLAERYNSKGLFPFTLLLNSEGKILKTWEGLPSESAVSFSNEIKSFYQKK
ncbi:MULTISPECIES: thioredoxin family protein [Chryseobacterium group]|uniref:Thiol-disulfide isomerase n=2 Tax=Chryseobacterium group TaxID=2782232 RepID=A0A085B9E5_9FLAO|nr:MULTISPECIES: thioredoxin family protein [Chryseobacterium group]AZA89877.1 thioredoxin family protein [Chryseobacterium nakagawai]KFC19090.1 thiol-disulfide isomerase [Epilithonimonas lactis]SEQ93125.1 Thioredoxin-like [Epilithonimonas lactis]VEH21285.1 Disulfide bond reductase DsbH precursor [Chryseobacterium nakagawai]